MRNILLSLVVLFAVSNFYGSDQESRTNIFPGEWVVIPASSPASFLLEFKENGRVINKTTKLAGTYEFLKNDRILLEFTGEILIMEYYESDGSILLNGVVGVQPQPVSLSLVPPTTDNLKEVEETYETRYKAQQQAILRMQRQSIEVAIKNNLRQFASAAQTYMLENGAASVSYKTLVETEKLLNILEPVNGESYDDLSVDMDTNAIQVLDADGTVHEYVF